MNSEPPLSSAPLPPKKSGAGLYVVGILALVGMSAALLWYRQSSSDPDAAPPKKPIASATAATESEPPPSEAPPPPPDEDESEQADDDATKKDGDKTAKGTRSSGKAKAAGPGPCGKCGAGVSTGALNSAVRRQAGMARGCYNRALKRGGAQGSMTVSVSVGSTGAVCGVAVVADSVNNAGIRSCVVGKFRGASYPKPKEGCVTVNVPISFKMK